MRPKTPDVADLQKSLYDTDETPEEDLWFLPGPGARAGQWEFGPDSGVLEPLQIRSIGAQDWLDAEAGAGRMLAQAAAACARYDERLSRLPGCEERIALMCASAALEMQGDWMPAERIALYVALREKAGEEAQILSQADWAVRRLLGGLDPRDDLNGYLGRHPTDRDGFLDLDLFGEPARGEEFSDLSRAWLMQLQEVEDAGAPALVRAGAGFHHWRMLHISAPGCVVEAAVLASALGADGTGAAFVPSILGQRQSLLARGRAADRLDGWLIAVRDGCARALLELERVERWQDRAVAATQDLSGKTPPLVIAELMRHALVSADMLSAATGASKAAIRRNMAEFERRGLVREVTGQGRYRFWGIKA